MANQRSRCSHTQTCISPAIAAMAALAKSHTLNEGLLHSSDRVRGDADGVAGMTKAKPGRGDVEPLLQYAKHSTFQSIYVSTTPHITEGAFWMLERILILLQVRVFGVYRAAKSGCKVLAWRRADVVVPAFCDARVPLGLFGHEICQQCAVAAGT